MLHAYTKTLCTSYMSCTLHVSAVCLTLEVVEVWILCHSAVEEGPGQVVHCVLFVLNRLCHHLRIEVVVHEVIQVRLCGEKVRLGVAGVK